MIRNSILRIVVALVVTATVAHAGPGKENSMSGTLSIWGGNPAVFGLGPAAFGGQYQLGLPMGQTHHWVAAPAFELGYGRTKQQITGPTSTTLTESAVTWGALVDFLYYSDCCDDDDFYCGPGIFYESTRPKDDPAPPGATFDPYNTFGGQLSVGGGMPYGKNMELVGSFTERFGFTSYDHTEGGTETKLTGTTFSTKVNGGLRWRF